MTTAQYGIANALDRLAELSRSNKMLKRAIDEYEKYFEMNVNVNDTEFKIAAERCIDRMRFIGNTSICLYFHSTYKANFILRKI